MNKMSTGEQLLAVLFVFPISFILSGVEEETDE